jgi:DNA invertase Pin-like site-specific DNA recombinase
MGRGGIMKLVYIRVSSTDQNTDRQDIKGDNYFIDKCSGSNTARPELDNLKRHIRQGDEIHVHSIDRLARSLTDLHALIKFFTGKGCSVHFRKENIVFSSDKTNPMNELMLNLLGSVYQFERSILKERQREGIEKAKEKGVYKGRSTSARLKSEIITSYHLKTPQRQIAKELCTSLSTVQRIIKAEKGRSEPLI